MYVTVSNSCSFSLLLYMKFEIKTAIPDFLENRSFCFRWSAATIKQLKLSKTSFLLFLEVSSSGTILKISKLNSIVEHIMLTFGDSSDFFQINSKIRVNKDLD